MTLVKRRILRETSGETDDPRVNVKTRAYMKKPTQEILLVLILCVEKYTRVSRVLKKGNRKSCQSKVTNNDYHIQTEGVV